MAYEEGSYTAEMLAGHRAGEHAEDPVEECPVCSEADTPVALAHLRGQHKTGEESSCWVCNLPAIEDGIPASIAAIRASQPEVASAARFQAEKEGRLTDM